MIIMLCYARSGGTIFNKCLASLPETIMLSEVNPLGGGAGVLKEKSYKTVHEQALYWYDIKLKNKTFRESIIELNDYCEKTKKNLIIRDWSFINFSPQTENSNHPPNEFLILKALKGLNPNRFALVRNAIDVWISRGAPDPQTFFNEYLTYTQKLIEQNIFIVKYENFTYNPVKQIKRLCTKFNIKSPKNIDLAKIAQYDKVNGDIQLGGKSRGNKLKTIKQLERKKISPTKIQLIENNADLKKANELLGYPTSYYDLQLTLKDRITNKLLSYI